MQVVQADLLHSTAKNAQAFWFDECLRLVRARASCNGISVVESLMPKGFTSPLHRHADEHDIFHILDGAIAFWLDGEIFVGQAGEIVSLPPVKPHAFKALVRHTRCLGLYKGDHFANLIATLGVPATALMLPPPEANRLITAADIERTIDVFAAKGEKFDIDQEILGPPPHALLEFQAKGIS
jgi:quercetin dioxygenase-like cupin family protein